MPKAGVGRADRGALVGILVVIFGALGWYLWLARRAWFVADEWDFLVDRSATNLHDLFRPHNEHWSTVPILLWRGLFQVFGIRTYVPYLLLVLVAHLALAFLLWTVMRRAGVRPWIATAAATLFVLFGTGYDGFLGAFNITFTGSLLCGVGQLLLADHDGPISRRDVFAVLVGLVGLMSSGLGVTMTVVVGLAVLARRGWRPALFQTVPLAAAYLVWFAVIGHEGYRSRAPISNVPGFVYDQFRETFRTLGQLPGLGLLLAAGLVVGLVLLVRRTPVAELRRRAAPPLALLAGSLVFATLAGLGRATSVDVFGLTSTETPSRYLYVMAALLLPALALALSTIAELRPIWGVPVAAAVFLIAVPGNVRTVVHETDASGPVIQSVKQGLVGIASLPVATELPRDALVPARYFSGATVGWLVAAKDAGRLPEVTPLSPAEANALTQELVLQGVPRPASTEGCEVLHHAVERRLGQQTRVISSPGGTVALGYLPSSGPAPPPVVLRDGNLASPATRVQVSGLRFRIDPRHGTATVCRARSS